MARELAKRYRANLVITARRKERLAALKLELEGHGVQVQVVEADMAQLADVDRLFEDATANKQLCAAILNAGVTHFGEWDELDWEGFVQMQMVNNTSVARLTTRLLPYFERQFAEQGAQAGGLMLVASMAGLMPLPYQSMYSATKAFLVNMGASLHHEMWPRNVSVTTFVPGGIKTEMNTSKRFDALRAWLMPAEECAAAAVKALRERKYMHTPGLMYAWGGQLSKFLPQRFYISQLGQQYKRSLDKGR
jgi:short-subunit dehydrogenase